MNNRNRSFIIVLSLLCVMNALSLRINSPDRITSTENPNEKWTVKTAVPSSPPSLPSKLTQEVSNGSSDATGHPTGNGSTKSPSSSSRIPSLPSSSPAPSTSPSPSPAPSSSVAPSSTIIPIRIEIRTDDYPDEISWDVRNVYTKEVILAGGPYKDKYTLHTDTVDVHRNGCHLFTIKDSYSGGLGDGGNYKVFYDDKLVIEGSGKFGSEESTFIGCPSALSSTPSSAPSLSLCKTSADWTSVLVFYGSAPDCRLPECAGHCNSDSDCDSGLFCFQPSIGGINTSVPGCETVPYDNTNYCVAKELKPSPVPSRSPSTLPSLLPTMTLEPSHSPSSKPSALPTVSSAPSRSPMRERSFPPTLTMTQKPTEEPQCSPAWKLLGNYIDTHDRYFAMAKDRLVSAVGRADVVAVFRFDDNSFSWIQIGEPINPQMSQKYRWGFSLSLSSDGSVIAIGDRKNYVKIFAVHSDDRWTQLGQRISGETLDEDSGRSIKLSADGTTIAIGAPHNNGNGPFAGHVRVYKYDTQADSWVQIGGDIDGGASGDLSGVAVSLSRDGSNVAIGARGSGRNGNVSWSGHVRIYNYNNDALKWIQRGGDINGEAAGDYSGSSVAMSGDGSTVVIGAEYNDGNGSNAGHVRVYIFNTTKNNWDQRGDDIDGEAAGDQLGQSVDISDDSATIVIGASGNDGSFNNAGQVRVYQHNSIDDKWIQKGADLDGGMENRRLGRDVSISSEGTVIGATAWGSTNLKIWKWTTCTTLPSSMPSVAPTCTNEQHTLRFDITTDRFPHQTTWSIKNLEEETVLSGGPYAKMFALYSETNCMDKGCYRFTIQDSSSDGLCCNWFTGNGKYELFLDSILINEGGNFTLEESSIQFGIECPSSAPSISSSPSISSVPTKQMLPPCPPGTFANISETDSELRCQSCPPGSYQDKETYSATCIKCKKGSYQEEKGRTLCNLCLAGTYQADEGKLKCDSCPRGSFQVAVGQTKCNECRVGGYCDTSLSGTCNGGFKPCGAGTYNNLKGRYSESSCLPCPAGKYTDKDGFSECLSCPHRLGSTMNSTSCPFCAADFYLRDPRASTSEILKTPADLCLTCPDNANCPGNTTLHTLEIKPDYWRDSLKTATIYQCKYNGVCVGGSVICKDYHSGPLCEVCKAGKYLQEKSGECSDCPTATKFAILISVLSLISIIIIIGCIATASTRNGRRCIDIISSRALCIGLQVKLKIILSFLQVVSILESVYGVRMNDNFKAWFTFLKYFNFQLLNYFLPKECLGSMRVQLLLSSTWPFILLAISVIGAILYTTCLKKLGVHGSNKSKVKILSRLLHMSIIIIYVLLPSVSNTIFDAIRCRSFAADDNSGRKSSYLLEDASIMCNGKNKNYKHLLTTFWILFTIWPVAMPLICAGLLWYIRKSVVSDRITYLSEACHFIWRDYNKEHMFWEVLDVVRKITLTGLIMFIDREQGSEKLLRLVIAIVLSTIYLGILALARPYKRNSDLYLAFISNVLLIGCFIMGIIINMCSKGSDICERFIGPFSSYQATIYSVILTAGMLVFSLMMLIVLARTTASNSTILVASTSSRPNLEMSEECHFHLFLSHVWSTGQDKTHNIVRMLQLHLPGIRIWLDVIELETVGGLEESIEDSEVFFLFYSKGYFESKNCCREVSEAISLAKPIVVLYEGDASTIEALKIEVRKCFSKIRDSNDILSHILKESPILWLGGKAQPFAIASVKLVILRLLHKLPYYSHRNRSAELNEGLQLGKRLDPSRFRYPKKIFYCNDNEGAKRRVVDDLREKVTGDVVFINDINQITSPVLDIKNEVLLLYLNDDLFQDTDGRVRVLVEKSLEGGRKILLICENDANMGKCEFEYHISQTPQALLNLDIYGEIALPLYTTPEYRVISLYLLQKKLSKLTSPEEKGQSIYTNRSALKRFIVICNRMIYGR